MARAGQRLIVRRGLTWEILALAPALALCACASVSGHPKPILQGDVEATRSFLASSRDLERRDWRGRTLLHSVAARGHARVAELLIEAGADGEARVRTVEATPLVLAALGGHPDTVRLLLEHGADPRQRTIDGEEPLHAAARSGSIEVGTLLLDAGVPVELGGGLNPTPLMVAAEAGQVDFVRFLVSRGANVNAGDRRGFTPLTLAVIRGHADLTDVLIEAGADSDVVGSGDTLLHHAASHGRAKMAERLLGRGADLESLNARGQTPLTLAAVLGHEPVVELLVRAGARTPPIGDSSEEMCAAGIIERVRGHQAAAEGSAQNHFAASAAHFDAAAEAYADQSWELRAEIGREHWKALGATLVSYSIAHLAAKGQAKTNARIDAAGSKSGKGTGRGHAYYHISVSDVAGLQRLRMHVDFKRDRMEEAAEAAKAAALCFGPAASANAAEACLAESRERTAYRAAVSLFLNTSYDAWKAGRLDHIELAYRAVAGRLGRPEFSVAYEELVDSLVKGIVSAEGLEADEVLVWSLSRPNLLEASQGALFAQVSPFGFGRLWLMTSKGFYIFDDDDREPSHHVRRSDVKTFKQSLGFAYITIDFLLQSGESVPVEKLAISPSAIVLDAWLAANTRD